MKVPTSQPRLRINVTKANVLQLRSSCRATATDDIVQTSTSPSSPTCDLPRYPIIPLTTITVRYAAPDDGSHTRAGNDDKP